MRISVHQRRKTVQETLSYFWYWIQNRISPLETPKCCDTGPKPPWRNTAMCCLDNLPGSQQVLPAPPVCQGGPGAVLGAILGRSAHCLARGGPACCYRASLPGRGHYTFRGGEGCCRVEGIARWGFAYTPVNAAFVGGCRTCRARSYRKESFLLGRHISRIMFAVASAHPSQPDSR